MNQPVFARTAIIQDTGLLRSAVNQMLAPRIRNFVARVFSCGWIVEGSIDMYIYIYFVSDRSLERRPRRFPPRRCGFNAITTTNLRGSEEKWRGGGADNSNRRGTVLRKRRLMFGVYASVEPEANDSTEGWSRRGGGEWGTSVTCITASWKPVSAPINFSPLIYTPATPSISVARWETGRAVSPFFLSFPLPSPPPFLKTHVFTPR